MTFDQFLAKLFSRKSVVAMIITALLATAVTACDWSTEEQILCVACGCIMPDRCYMMCEDACDCGAEGCSDCIDESRPHNNKGTASCAACNAVKDVMTDENGDPIDCEDVGCPECQKYFECE